MKCRRHPRNGTSASIPLHHESKHWCIQPRLRSICWAWHTELGSCLDGPCAAPCSHGPGHGHLAFAVQTSHAHTPRTHTTHAHDARTRAATFFFPFLGGPQQTFTHTIRSNKYLPFFFGTHTLFLRDTVNLVVPCLFPVLSRSPPHSLRPPYVDDEITQHRHPWLHASSNVIEPQLDAAAP